jgi:hypothetical protein
MLISQFLTWPGLALVCSWAETEQPCCHDGNRVGQGDPEGRCRGDEGGVGPARTRRAPIVTGDE